MFHIIIILVIIITFFTKVHLLLFLAITNYLACIVDFRAIGNCHVKESVATIIGNTTVKNKWQQTTFLSKSEKHNFSPKS